jgi:hypothetical protein
VKCVSDATVGHFSRKKFPNKVYWEDIEFNQLATVRTALWNQLRRDRNTGTPPASSTPGKGDARRIRFHRVGESIQSRRVITSRELFERFVPELADMATGLGVNAPLTHF